MKPKNIHISYGDLIVNLSKKHKKIENFLREIGSLNLHLKSKKSKQKKRSKKNSTLDVLFSNLECETDVLKINVSAYYEIHLKVSDLNDNQNNTIGEDEQEKQIKMLNEVKNACSKKQRL